MGVRMYRDMAEVIVYEAGFQADSALNELGVRWNRNLVDEGDVDRGLADVGAAGQVISELDIETWDCEEREIDFTDEARAWLANQAREMEAAIACEQHYGQEVSHLDILDALYRALGRPSMIERLAPAEVERWGSGAS